jgi:hypothetical protein
VANGTDEQGNAVNGYVLGAGDIYVMEGDSVIPDPSTTKSYVKLCDTLPTTPSKGDAYFQNGVLVIYDGTSWVPACDISSLETQIAKKRDLDDFSIQGVPEGEGSWFVFEREQTDLLRFDWETSEWESDAGISIRLNTWEPGEPPYYMTDTE